MSSRSFETRLRRLEERKRGHCPSLHRILPGWLTQDSAPAHATSSGWHYDALPAQRSFHGDLTTRFKGYSGPIGSGKSYALAYEALFLSMLNPGLLGRQSHRA